MYSSPLDAYSSYYFIARICIFLLFYYCFRYCSLYVIDRTFNEHTFAFFPSDRQVRDGQWYPSSRIRLRATGPRPQPVGLECGGRLLIHRSGWHTDQRQVCGRPAGIRASRWPSAHAAAITTRNRQVAPIPGHPTVHTGTGLQQQEVMNARLIPSTIRHSPTTYGLPPPITHSFERPFRKSFVIIFYYYRLRFKFCIC